MSPRRPLLLAVSAALAMAQAAHGQTPRAPDASTDWPLPHATPTPDLDAVIAEASRRFGVPSTWINAVIRAESGCDPQAVSSAGAMGLMQLMPATYAEMRAAHGLGSNPFQPRDNILAGVAYMRRLYDRFGPSGVLSAYNAGPGRYADHLATGRSLPAETLAYGERVRRYLRVGWSADRRTDAASTTSPADPPRSDPYASPLFVARPWIGSTDLALTLTPPLQPRPASGPMSGPASGPSSGQAGADDRPRSDRSGEGG